MRFIHFKYARYMLRHKWFVFQECRRLGITWLGIIHDLSKFLPDEWSPYARYFYGKYPTNAEMVEEFKHTPSEFKMNLLLLPTKESVSNAFDAAWLEHIHRNRHHPQYYLLKEDSGNTVVLRMPDRYMREMLADWIGAGKAQKNPDGCVVWYGKNKDKIVLHPDTRRWIEAQLHDN